MTIKQKANRARIEAMLASFNKHVPHPTSVEIVLQRLLDERLIKWSGYSTTRNSVQLVWEIESK